MGKNRRPTKRNRPSSAVSGRSELNLEPLITTLLWSLFFARWLIPTEGTAEGNSLWLAAFTLPVAAIWFWWQSRREISRVSPGLIDAAAWSLAGAHILSAIFVIAGEGEKRLAMNMLWEWFSLAVLVSTLRQTLLNQTARERFLQTLVALGIALSLFGIWQHYFWYASNVREYDAQRSELDELEASTSLDIADRLRKSKLQSDFLREGIPLSGPQRGLFEIRIRDSSEPLGFFALANSFAGILSAVTVLLVAGLIQSIIPVIRPRLTSDGSPAMTSESVVPRETPTSLQKWIQENGLTIGCLAVVGFTLLLTKSRTAYIGTAAGIGFAALMSLAGLKRDALKRVAAVAALAIVMAGVLTGVAIATGALDIEVLSEAPKSIQYRFQYWSGTARVIAQSPWFGVGPGNFRPHYLQHKLAETSEEIADPHNFLLDVMANAGVPGVLALILLAVVFVRNTRSLFLNQRRKLDQPASRKATDQEADAPLPAIVICVAVAIAAGWQFAAEAYLNFQLLSVGIFAIVFAAASSRLQSKGRAIPGASLTPTAFAAATVALLVHLLAAGGIAMPAICGCLLALLILTQLPRADENESPVESSAKSRVVSLVLAVALVTTFAACLQTSFLPVIRATAEIQSGDYEATLQSRYDRAKTRYLLAAQFDPLSPGPLMRLADVSFLIWEQTRDHDRFIEGVNFALEAEKRNPHSGFYAYQIGRRYRQRFQKSHNGEHAQAAVKWLSKALRLYPTHPLWNAEYTIALDEAGLDQEAISAAETTLRLEKINQAAGHLDKFLPEPVLSEIHRIIGVDLTATK
jgi:O-antigen ligase